MDEHDLLSWLSPKPDDFSDKLAAAKSGVEPIAPQLKALAGYALGLNDLHKIAKALRQARKQGRSLRPLTELRLGVVSNSTMSLILPALEATALRYGLALEAIETPFGQVVQQALDPQSEIALAAPDVVLVALDSHGFALQATLGDYESAEAALAAALAEVETIRSGLRANTRATLMWQTVPRHPETLLGSYDFRLPGTKRWLIDQFNRRLADTMPDDELLVDVAAVAENVGLIGWHDPIHRNASKLPFAPQFVPLYAEHVVRVIGALRGKSRKALVLDLDNTLWGGVIGDDGLEGIVIGQGDALGEAHLAVQQTALDLRARGIALAVSSKNEDHIARLPFREHGDMLLHEDHITVFQANWLDKASNLATIADTLALGRDALVFLDDNPAERKQVRDTHPEIAVPEIGKDAAFYPAKLLAAGYFEAITFSDDDRKRSTYYQENARRSHLQVQAGSLEDYQKSLNMRAQLKPFDAVGRARIAQLINKSNQFNLTTRRYTEAQVAEMEHSPAHFTLQVRLEDVFGDNGMISVIIAVKVDAVWEIDTWLMSCRVLGRGVEAAVLNTLIGSARAAGATALRGRFIPTDRNMMVAAHYQKLGFAKVEEMPDGETIWLLDLATAQEKPVPIDVTFESVTA